MRDIRLVFQSSCACRTLSPGPIRPVLPASLWCQHRAIRLIGHGNTDETFQKEKNIGLGYWFNIINHGQESAINGVCFLLEADRWRSLRAGMRMGIVWPVQWTLLSSAWPDVKVHRKVCCRLHRCQLYIKKKKTHSHLYLSRLQCMEHMPAGATAKRSQEETEEDKMLLICRFIYIGVRRWCVSPCALDTAEMLSLKGRRYECRLDSKQT